MIESSEYLLFEFGLEFPRIPFVVVIVSCCYFQSFDAAAQIDGCVGEIHRYVKVKDRVTS